MPVHASVSYLQSGFAALIEYATNSVTNIRGHGNTKSNTSTSTNHNRNRRKLFLLSSVMIGISVSGYYAYKYLSNDCDWPLSRMTLNAEYFSNRVVWITGASEGIGQQLVFKLCALPNIHNLRLVLTARNKTKLLQIKRRILSSSLKMKESDIFIADFDLSKICMNIRDEDHHKSKSNDNGAIMSAQPQSVQQLYNGILRHFQVSQIDILINNAGIACESFAHALDAADIIDIMTVDLLAPQLLSRLCLADMLATTTTTTTTVAATKAVTSAHTGDESEAEAAGAAAVGVAVGAKHKPGTDARFGHIVNISSLITYALVPLFSYYSSAKCGLSGFSLSLSGELWMHPNVNCSLFSLGAVQTDCYRYCRCANGALKQERNPDIDAGMAVDRCADLLLIGISNQTEHAFIGIPTNVLACRIALYLPLIWDALLRPLILKSMCKANFVQEM